MSKGRDKHRLAKVFCLSHATHQLSKRRDIPAESELPPDRELTRVEQMTAYHGLSQTQKFILKYRTDYRTINKK